MSIGRILLAVTLVALPLTLEAQRDRGGFGKMPGTEDTDKMIKATEEKNTLSKSLEKANPLAIMLDRKKDIKLTDDEQKELKSMVSALKDGTKPFFKTLDSAQKEISKPGDYAPTSGQLVILRRVQSEAADSIRARYTAAQTEALCKIAEERRTTATETVQKAQQELREQSRGRGN